MSDPIVVCMSWSVREHLKMYWWNFRRRVSKPLAVANLSILLLLPPFILVPQVSKDFFLLVPIFAFVPMVAWVYWMHVRLHVEMHTGSIWKITDEKIRLETTDLNMEFQWTYLTEVVQTPDGFLLCRPTQCYWLPLRCFEDVAMPKRLAGIAGKQAAKFRILN